MRLRAKAPSAFWSVAAPRNSAFRPWVHSQALALPSASRLIVWFALKFLVPGGVRVSEAHELEGLDIAECGVEAYNEELKGFHAGASAMSAVPAE